MNETIKNGVNVIGKNTGISIAVVGIIIIGVIAVANTDAKTNYNARDIAEIKKDYMPREVLDEKFDTLNGKLDILIDR